MQITGREPQHWHTESGKHNMTDPRTIDGWRFQYWSEDERAYVGHLMQHDGDIATPLPDDPDIVKNMLALIAKYGDMIATMHSFIYGIREMRRQGMSDEEVKAVASQGPEATEDIELGKSRD